MLSTTTIQLASPTVTSFGQTEILRSLLANQSAFSQFALFDNHDHETSAVTRIQTNSSVASAQFASRVTSNILTQTKKGQIYISPVYFDPANNVPLVLMAVPMIDILGNYQGTLAAELNLISMWNLVNQLKVGNAGYAYVVNSQGTLLASKYTTLQGENMGDIQLVHEFVLNPASAPAKGMSIYTGINGARVIGAYAPLGTPNWAVVTELPWQEAYQPVFQVIAASIGIILLMAILAGLAGVLIARRLAVPLVDLTKTASRIAGGEMQLQATSSGAQEITSLAIAFNSMTAQLRELISSLEQRVADRTKEVERQVLRVRTAAEIARDISSAPNLDELLTRTGELIVNRFNFYHTGIFLLDDKKEYAVLYASPTEAGKQLIANSHRLRVGEQGIVGRVAASGEARIALDTGADAVYFNNPLLPTTRSEMALPLKTRNEILGVLDIQSNQPRAFVQEDIEILQVLTDQLAIAIERINLLKRAEDQLKEIEQAYQDFTQRSWQGLARNQTQIAGYRFDGIQLQPIIQAPESLVKTVQTGTKNTLQTQSSNLESQAIPIRLRGQTIGIVNLRLHSDTVSKETIAIVEQIADRLASALESARLTEDTRRRAQRERVIGEVTAKISQSINLQNILQTAVEELGRVIPGSDVVIQIQDNNENGNYEKRSL